MIVRAGASEAVPLSRETIAPAGAVTARALRLFGDVRTGEAGTTLLLLSNLFVLLVAYYLLKTAREPLILAYGGAELKSYAAAAQALALIGFVPAYGWVASRVSRLALIVTLTLVFAANLVIFALAATAGARIGFAFYVWVGIFSLATIAQFWSYANDLFRRDVGERLFPVIAIGAAVGSPVGAKVAELLFKAGVPVTLVLQFAGALLMLQLALYWVVDRRAGHDRPAVERRQPVAERGGFALVLGSPYLRWVAALLLLLNLVNTTGEYIVGRMVVDAADHAASVDPAIDRSIFIGSFYGGYFFWVNVVAVILQAFLASRIVKYAGTAGAIVALPLVALGAYGLVAAGAGFALVRWVKTAENATDYSVMNTGRQLLWLPTTRGEKYTAKQAIDTFIVRFGDMASAGFVFAGTAWLFLDVRGFAWLNLFVIGLWLMVAYRVMRGYRRLCADCP